MEKSSVIREDLVKAFNIMWGKAPWPVMLVYRDHTIVAPNPLCVKMVRGSYCGQKCVNVELLFCFYTFSFKNPVTEASILSLICAVSDFLNKSPVIFSNNSM